ncbi:MAG: LytTR family DNA-binding domain-containing protein [Pseudomonadota bacterium]
MSRTLTNSTENIQAPFRRRFIANLRARLTDPAAIGLSVAMSLGLAIMGPFNTFDADPFWDRLLFWGVVVVFAAIHANTSAAFVDTIIPERCYLVRSFGASALFVPIYFLALRYWIALTYPNAETPSNVYLFSVVVLVTAAIFFFINVIDRGVSRRVASATVLPPPLPPQPAKSPVDASVPKLLRRVGPGAGKQLIRMAMADHYVELFSETGKHLLHMRFTDAVAELPDNLGGQVHRSHWVAWDQIAGANRDGQKRWFVLKDGTQVPIARSRVAELKYRGVLP